MKKRHTFIYFIAVAFAAALGSTPAKAAITPGDPVDDPVELLDLDAGMIVLGNAAVATDADGDVIVAWTSVDNGVAPPLAGVYYRRIAADGSVGETETLLEQSAIDIEIGVVDVAVDANGDAIVAWDIDRDPALVAGKIEARWIAASGEPKGDVIEVSPDALPSTIVQAGMDAEGNAVIAWQTGEDIHFRRYGVDGTPIGDTGTANITPAALSLVPFPLPDPPPIGPLLAVGSNGHFVIGWKDETDVLRVRAFSPLGRDTLTPASDEIELGSALLQLVLALAVEPDGRFAAAWYGTDVAVPYVAARRFDASGVALAEPALLPGDSTGTTIQFPLNIRFEPDGDVIVDSLLREADKIEYRRSRLDAGTLKDLDSPWSADFCQETLCEPVAISADADGDEILVYRQQGDDFTRLYAQRYRGAEAADLAVTLDASADEAVVGDTVTLTMSIENLHPVSDYYGNTTLDQAVGATSGITVTLDLPAPFALPEDTGDWICTEDGESTSCTHPGMLYAGDRLTLEATHEMTADDVGEHVFAATVNADRVDPVADNNIAEIRIAVAGDDDSDDAPPPATSGGGGGGALGWLVLLLAPLARRPRLHSDSGSRKR